MEGIMNISCTATVSHIVAHGLSARLSLISGYIDSQGFISSNNISNILMFYEYTLVQVVKAYNPQLHYIYRLVLLDTVFQITLYLEGILLVPLSWKGKPSSSP